MTDNHNYETPERGATDWDKSLNTNFRYIDRDVEIRDIDSAKGDYNPKNGAKFLATDTENVYVGSGNEWLRLATSGEDPLFDAVSASEVVDRNSGNSYSVDELAGGSGGGSVEPPVDAIVTLDGGTPTAYRADGTQIGQDSDTAVVIEAAVSDVGENSVIEIEAGEFPINSRANLISRMTLRGAGMGNTVLNCQSSSSVLSNGVTDIEYLSIEGITVDGQNQGDFTGFVIGGFDEFPKFSRIKRCEAINCGPRGNNSTPSILISGGTGNRIEGCRASNCSSVSIEIKKGQNPVIRDCLVRNGNYQSNVGFCHGISAEKSKGGIIANNYIEGPAFGPSINVNNSGNFVVSGNLVRNVHRGIANANGGNLNTAITGNVVRNTSGPGIQVKTGNAGGPRDHLISGNTVMQSAVSIGSHAVVNNNILRASPLSARNMPKPLSVTSNYFENVIEDDGSINDVTIENHGTDDPLIFANNHFSNTSRDDDLGNVPAVRIAANNGIVTGNHFGATTGKAPLKIDARGAGEYFIIGNTFRQTPRWDSFPSPALNVANSDTTGVAAFNRINRGQIGAGGKINYHDNIYINGGFLNLDVGDFDDNNRRSRAGTYTGDGTTGRSIRLAVAPEYVVIEGSDGAKYDVHRQFGTGYHHTTPTGELSLTDNGIIVGSSSGGNDPNISGENYTFYAR